MSCLHLHWENGFYSQCNTQYTSTCKWSLQQENGIKCTLTSIPQMATTTWTEQTKSSWLDWEQDITGWMLICTVSSRLARRIAVLVTQPQWLASTYSKAAPTMMLSGEKHGQRTSLWGTSSLVTHRLCGGQQLLFDDRHLHLLFEEEEEVILHLYWGTGF